MPRVCLSFDNGPHPQGTPQILDVLARRGLKATFFLVAEKLRDPALRAIAQQAHAAGHRLANHTLTHGVALGRLSGPGVPEEEIGVAQALLGDLAAEKLFRPNGEKGQLGPHLLSEDAVLYLEREGYTAVCWNCVPQDWIGAPGDWVPRAEAMLRGLDWAAIVLHDHCLAGHMQDLEGFLDRLVAQGWEFTNDFPPDVVLVDKGWRTPALQGLYTPTPATL